MKCTENRDYIFARVITDQAVNSNRVTPFWILRVDTVNRNTETPSWSLLVDNEQKYKDAILELEAVISQGTERGRHTLVSVISQ